MIETAAWLLLAAVHAMPALALFRPSLLGKLSRLAPGNPLFLLMQHRAALFFAIFATSIWAAFYPEPRQFAVVVVGISMVSFLFLYVRVGMPKALRRIARVDLIGLPALVFVAWSNFLG